MGQEELSYLPRTLIRPLTRFLAIFPQHQRLREGPLPSGSCQFHGGGEICSPKNGEWKQSKVQGRSQGPVVRVEEVRREGFQEQGAPKALSLRSGVIVWWPRTWCDSAVWRLTPVFSPGGFSAIVSLKIAFHSFQSVLWNSVRHRSDHLILFPTPLALPCFLLIYFFVLHFGMNSEISFSSSVSPTEFEISFFFLIFIFTYLFDCAVSSLQPTEYIVVTCELLTGTCRI